MIKKSLFVLLVVLNCFIAIGQNKIEKTSDVGIGTENPRAKLEIARSSYSIGEGLRLTDLDGGASEGLWIQFAQANMEDMGLDFFSVL
jgi:hypothetical protein